MKPYRIMETGRAAVDHLVRAHYLHKWPGVVTMTLALMEGSIPIGTIVFAMPPRETMVRYRVDLAWELARLFILDCTPKNTESWFIARAVEFVRKNRPDVGLLVSYADPSAGHSGTIYRAANWIADGCTDQGRKTARFDYAGQEECLSTLFGEESRTAHYSRKAHVPEGVVITRTPRVSKPRFVFWLDGSHEKRRYKIKLAI